MAPTMAPIITVIRGLEQRGQVVDGDLDLLVVELADLSEHPVQRTGLLAHFDHLDDQGGDDVLMFPERIGQGTAFANRHSLPG